MNQVTRRLAVGGGGLCLITAVVLGVFLPSPDAHSGETPPTTSWPTSAANAATSASDSEAGTTALAVLPAGTKVTGTHLVNNGRADFTDVTLEGHGLAYDVTYYHDFASKELVDAGLQSVKLSVGTVWIGDNGADFRSVYFLSASGHGVYVSTGSPSDPVAAPLSTLETYAVALSKSDLAAPAGGS